MEQYNRTTRLNSTYSRTIKELDGHATRWWFFIGCPHRYIYSRNLVLGVLSFAFNDVSTPNGTVSAHQRNTRSCLRTDLLLYKVCGMPVCEKRQVTHSASHIWLTVSLNSFDKYRNVCNCKIVRWPPIVVSVKLCYKCNCRLGLVYCEVNVRRPPDNRTPVIFRCTNSSYSKAKAYFSIRDSIFINKERL